MLFLQLLQSSVLRVAMACSNQSMKVMMAASLQVGEAEKLEWLVASCTALVGSNAFSCLSSCRSILPWETLVMARCMPEFALLNLDTLNVL